MNKSISYSMFSESRNITVTMKIFYLYCMTLKIKVKHFCMTHLIFDDTDLILVSIPNSPKTGSKKMNCLTLTVNFENQGHTHIHFISF